jgi:ABC-type transport system involved in multi-copper enzyme maturation permease subunit
MSGLRHAVVRAEWTKLRSLPANAVAVVAVVVLTVGLSAFMCAVGHTDATRPGQGDDDVVENSLRGVYIGQIAVVAFAVGTVAAEFATGVIRTTFTAAPRRRCVALAKAVTLAGAVLASGLVASVLAFLVSQPLLHASGFRPPAYPVVALNEPAVVRAVIGTALYLTALAVLGLAAGAITRHAAPAITALAGLLLAPIALGSFLPDTLADPLQRYTPIAGLAIQRTVHDASAPIGPWAGLAVTWVWALAASTVAVWAIERRDV